MGNDGGTIAKRQDILSLHSYGNPGKNKTGQVVDDNEESMLNTCALSSLPLYNSEEPPIVSDYKGKLYLKEKILEYIIGCKNRKNLTDLDSSRARTYNHIHSMNDLVDVHIQWRTNDEYNATIECPISKELRRNNTTYAYLRPCGCVLSFKFLDGFLKHIDEKNSKGDGHRASQEIECPNCGKLFCFKYDVVILNPSDNPHHREFNQKSLSHLEHDLLLTHSKKHKKEKKKKKDRDHKNASTENNKRVAEKPDSPRKRAKTNIDTNSTKTKPRH